MEFWIYSINDFELEKEVLMPGRTNAGRFGPGFTHPLFRKHCNRRRSLLDILVEAE